MMNNDTIDRLEQAASFCDEAQAELVKAGENGLAGEMRRLAKEIERRIDKLARAVAARGGPDAHG